MNKVDYTQEKIRLFNSFNVKGESIADYGGGEGRILKELSFINRYLIDLVDVSLPEVDFFHPNEFHKKVDVVFLSMSLHHFKDLSLVLDHINETLNNGGSIIIREIDCSSKLLHKVHRDLDDYYYLGQKKYSDQVYNYKTRSEWEGILTEYFQKERFFYEQGNVYNVYWQLFKKSKK